jgi:hypothetical protein
LGLRSFFARRSAEPTAPAMAAQPSPEIVRGEAIGELRFVFMAPSTDYWFLIPEY